MHINAEFFLAYNFALTLLLLHTAAALSGLRLYEWRAIVCAALGAICALLGVWMWPFLREWWIRLLSVPLMALTIRFHDGHGFVRAVFFICCASAVLSGATMLLYSLLGGFAGRGILSWEILPWMQFLAVALCMGLPRLIRGMKALKQKKQGCFLIRITHCGKLWQGKAMLDSGNLLTEPLSGLPVIILTPNFVGEGHWPVPFEGINGTGILYAMKPDRIECCFSEWREMDALVARAPYPLREVDAIVGIAAIPFLG